MTLKLYDRKKKKEQEFTYTVNQAAYTKSNEIEIKLQAESLANGEKFVVKWADSYSFITTGNETKYLSGDSEQFNFQRYVDKTTTGGEDDEDEEEVYQKEEAEAEKTAEGIQGGLASTSKAAATGVGVVSFLVGFTLSLFWGFVNTIQMFEFISLV